MKLECFAIYDVAVKAWAQPVYFRSRGEAIRSFMQSCRDEKSNLFIFRTDYLFFYLGDYDDATGRFTNAGQAPERVISAAECVEDDITFPPDRKLPPG